MISFDRNGKVNDKISSMLKLGLIGCGNISKGHAAKFADLKDRMVPAVAVDIDGARAEAAAQELGGVPFATDYREVLQDVDAVLLALPHHLHYEIGMECLRSGKHVLMEKPLANTEQECLELIRCADEQKRVLMVAYCMRYNPLVRRLKKLLSEQAYGEVFHVSIWTEQFTKADKGHWLCDAKLLGGGQFFSHGCHYVDLLLWMLGEPASGSHLGTNLGTPWMEREGTSDAIIKFQSGAIGYHGGTWGARGTRLKWSIHAHCTQAMLELDLIGQRLMIHRGGREEEIGTVEELAAESSTDASNPKVFERQLQHFLECVEKGTNPETNGMSALQSLRVIWRLYEAEENGRVADLRGLSLPQHK